MPKNDIGGFFVSLGLNIDRDSFETGNRLIDGVGNSFNKLIGSARNAAVVLAGTAIATGSVESAAYKMSEKLNISTESLDLWKASAKIAGVDANGLIGAMGRMANVIDHMKIDGTGLEEFTKQLGKLGIITDEVDIAKMLDMAPDELMTVIIQKAQEASAQAKRDIAEAKKALEVNPNDTQAQTKLANAEDAKRQAQTIVGDILGDEGKGLFIELERQGRSIEELKSLASKTIFTDRQTNEASQDFMEQVRVTKTLSENITKLLGSDIGKALTPALTELNSWLIGHGDDIKNAMSSLAGAIEKIVGKTVDFVTDEKTQEKLKKGKEVATEAAETAKEGAAGTYKMVHGAITGDFEEAKEGAVQAFEAGPGVLINGAKEGVNTVQERIEQNKEYDVQGILSRVADEWNNKYGEHPVLNMFKKLGFDELPADLQNDINEYRQNVNKDWLPGSVSGKGSAKLQDGIVRPDGTVTQVAPDDWVFAARDIGAMAQAFIPHNYNSVSALSEYTINQTFNINGGSDMPQVLRQQAYRGTQEGLLEIMQQSSQRLQLMSGTR